MLIFFYGYISTDYIVSGGTVTDFTKKEYEEIKKALKSKLTDGEYCMDNMGGGILMCDLSADKLRPNVKAIYDALWELKKEGILKMEDKDHELSWLPGRTLKRTFFYI